jgi:hypothetical protein
MHVLSQKIKRLDVSLSTEVSSRKLGNAMGMYNKEQKLAVHLAQEIKTQRLQIEKIKQVLHTRAWGSFYIFSLPPSLPPSLPLPTPCLLLLPTPCLCSPLTLNFCSHFPLLRSSCPSMTYGLMIVFLMLLMIHFIFAALNATYLSVSFLTLPVCMRVYTQTLG